MKPGAVLGALSCLLCAGAPSLGARERPVYSSEIVPLDIPWGRGKRTLDAVIKRPVRDRGRLPAFIVFGGFETAGRVLDLFDPDVPVVLATFSYPYAGPKRFRFPRSLLDAPQVRASVRQMPLGIHELVLALSRRPDVDPDRLCIVGVSFGAPFAIQAAAREPGIGRLVIVQGFADIAGTMAHRLAQQWEGRLGRLAAAPAWLVSRLLVLYLAPPRPEKDAASLRADQQVLVVEAREDTFVPARSRELLWDALRRSKAGVERVVLPGEHLRPDARAQIRDIMELTERWMRLK